MADKTEGMLAEVKHGLLHIVHEDGEDYIDPERVVEVGEAMIEPDGEDPRMMVYLIIDGADEQLDVPGIDLDSLAEAWVKARGKGGK